MFVIYSKPDCPNCDKAKTLLGVQNLPYSELVLDVGQTRVEGVDYYTVDQLQQKVPGARSVPQIFKVDADESKLIGGFEALRQFLTK